MSNTAVISLSMYVSVATVVFLILSLAREIPLWLRLTMSSLFMFTLPGFLLAYKIHSAQKRRRYIVLSELDASRCGVGEFALASTARATAFSATHPFNFLVDMEVSGLISSEREPGTDMKFYEITDFGKRMLERRDLL